MRLVFLGFGGVYVFEKRGVGWVKVEGLVWVRDVQKVRVVVFKK